MLDQIILIISILAQLAAAIMAIRLISGNKRNFAALMIVTVIVLMFFKRAINWIFLMQENPDAVPEMTFRLIDMIISLALLSGILMIKTRIKNITAIADRLRESEERYAMAAEGARDGLWDWNLQTGKLYLSPRWKQMLGYKDSEMTNDPESWFALVHPADLESLKSAVFQKVLKETPHFEQEYRIHTRQGVYRWVLCRGVAVFDGQSIMTRLAGSQTDITRRKLAEQHLRQNALHDSLTGLPNRKQFISRLKRLMNRDDHDEESMFAVLFIDLDGFKNINDTWGHDIGDQYLIQTARRLESCIRPGDMVARLGGDEFTILLEHVDDKNDAIKIADRVLTELNMPVQILSIEMPITASIGISFSYPECVEPEDLVRNADTAMYSAKSGGKNCYAIYEDNPESRRLTLTRPRMILPEEIEQTQKDIN
jgi:diguanylate cyclase (GGDEF)-like protein/PAS domain S-box-containing protein